MIKKEYEQKLADTSDRVRVLSIGWKHCCYKWQWTNAFTILLLAATAAKDREPQCVVDGILVLSAFALLRAAFWFTRERNCPPGYNIVDTPDKWEEEFTP